MTVEHTTETVTFTLDGREVTANKGEVIIAAAERAGTYIPRFCYHPRMEPVGVCRMCLVEVEGPRGSTLMPSCFIPATDGMVVVTDSDKVKKAQDGVLEFLLANHPLDCPVCDKGGECPLQDQTLAYGPGESRFIEEKRHFEKPVPISDLVLLDRERCIQCSRCTRFADEIAGEAQIDFAGRGDLVEVSTFPTEPFSSYFSGNTVQICPVGALTATPYRFVARPWDLDQVESTCTGCSVGCRVAVQSSLNRLTRVLGVDSELSHGWLCDKGRFGFESVSGSHDQDAASGRVTDPMVRRNGELVAVSWNEALVEAAEILRAAGSSVGVLGGAELTNEGAYAWAKLAKGVLGTDAVDAQYGDGLPAELVLGLPQASIRDLESATTILTLTGDLREELPVLFLRLRDIVGKGATSLVQITEQPDALTALAQASIHVRSGDALAVVRELLGDSAATTMLKTHAQGPTFTDAVLEQAKALLPALGEKLVVVVGRQNAAEDGRLTSAAARLLAEAFPQATFVVALRRGNVRGALDMGLAPGILPGRVGLEEGRGQFSGSWTTLPAARGLGAIEQLSALANKAPSAPKALLILGSDLVASVPDANLLTGALANAVGVINVTGRLSDVSDRASVVLPITVEHERLGTTTNVEGRVSALDAAVAAPGQAWADWMVAVALGESLGADLGFTSLEGALSEIATLVGTHRGLTASLLSAAAGDGILMPLDGEGSFAPAAQDPMAFPGVKTTPAKASFSEAAVADTTPHAASTNAALLRQIDIEVAAPAPDGYALRLVAATTLFDGTPSIVHAPSLAALVPNAVAAVNPSDLDRLGLHAGDLVRLKSASGQLELPAEPDTSVARGAVVVASRTKTHLNEAVANAVATLVDATALVTDVRMESR